MIHRLDLPVSTLTPKQWEAEFDKKRLELQNDEGVPARRAMLRSRALTELKFGRQPPGPPGALSWAAAIIKAAFAAKKGGLDMTFLKNKAIWKMVRTAGVVALAGFVFNVASKMDEAGELEALGLPGGLAPLAAMGVASLVTLGRNWMAVRHPNLNLVKKVGDAVVKPIGRKIALRS